MWVSYFMIPGSATADELTRENTHIARKAFSVDRRESTNIQNFPFLFPVSLT